MLGSLAYGRKTIQAALLLRLKSVLSSSDVDVSSVILFFFWFHRSDSHQNGF